MYRIYKTQGIVIEGKPSGESSRKITLLCREVGLVHALVQNGRALSSKLRPNIQNFSVGEFSLVRGRNSWRLVGAQAQSNFFANLRGSQPKIKLAANILLLLKKIVAEAEIKELFDLVGVFLEELPKVQMEDLLIAENLVMLRILKKLGFLGSDPNLEECFGGTTMSENDKVVISNHRNKAIKLVNESLTALNLSKTNNLL